MEKLLERLDEEIQEGEDTLARALKEPKPNMEMIESDREFLRGVKWVRDYVIPSHLKEKTT